jgi:hypothetical protein
MTSGNDGGDVATPFVMLSGKNGEEVGIEGGAECGRSCVDCGLSDEEGGGVGVQSPASSNGGRFSGGMGFSGSPQCGNQLLECSAWAGRVGTEPSVATNMGPGMPYVPRRYWSGGGGLTSGNGRLLLVTRINGYERIAWLGGVGVCAMR